MSDVIIKGRDVVRDVSVTVRFDMGRTWSVRVMLASMLIRMAGRVVGCMVTVEVMAASRPDGTSEESRID